MTKNVQKEVIGMIRVKGIGRDGMLHDVGYLEGTIDGIRKTLEEIGWKILYIGYEETEEKREMSQRFVIGDFEIPLKIYDMETGAEVITVAENHDWDWFGGVDPDWSNEKYVRAIAETIVNALNKADIPKPKEK